MSAIQYVTSVHIFNQGQCQFYIVDNIKYHIRFPIDWAISHKTFTYPGLPGYGTGPKQCFNCRDYGSFRGIFVGYCSNCLIDYNNDRGIIIDPGSDIANMSNKTIWRQYPYMFNVDKYNIGLEETGEEETDEETDEEE
jgi:hypothetical protein